MGERADSFDYLMVTVEYDLLSRYIDGCMKSGGR